METWLDAGGLSDDEFDQLVRLTARHFLHDVDQRDDWVMPAETGQFFVSFSWEAQHPDDHRLVWPRATPGGRAWEVWRQDDNGNQVLMTRFGSPRAARMFAEAFERRHHRQSYWVVEPPSDV